MYSRSLLFASAAILLMFCYEAVSAQPTRSVANAGRRIDDFQRQADKAARDSMNREMRGRKPTKEELREAARIKEETREDLEGLQRAYNDIVTRLNGGQPLSPGFVSDVAAKVNRHAIRLKANIVFPKVEGKEEEQKAAVPIDDSRKSLPRLCSMIYMFLTNPMVENPHVLDLESAAAASDLLDSIITSSDGFAVK